MARVRLVNDYDEAVPEGEPGEVAVRGPLVFREYWNLQQESDYALRDGWHHTGDVGRFDEDGYLFYVRRKQEKQLIKPGGENVYHAEVEKALLQHPEVAEACVFGVPDAEWGEAVKAVCVKREGSDLQPENLIEFVGARIARYKKPKWVVFIDSLPRTKEAAIDREKVMSEFR